MPGVLRPSTSEELRDALATASTSKRTIELFGANSKRRMAGPVEPANVRITTAGMRRILQYEPRDLTISVEAGIPFAELNAVLARNGQMIPLDGAFMDEATASLDLESEVEIYESLKVHLPDTTLVSIAHRPSVAAYHDGKIVLQRSGNHPGTLTLETPA